jgi:carboxyl-terminal processing protease
VAVSSELCGSPNAATGAATNANVAYIRISTFNKRTSDLFFSQLKKLKLEGANAYVLDLRNNGGGYFPAGVQVQY